MLSRLKIRHRLWLLIALSCGALLAIAGYSLDIQREALMQARRAKTVTALELAYGVVDHYGQLAAAGALPLAAAQEAAKTAIGELRYDRDNYFSTYDLSYRMVKHPIKPEMDGQDWSRLKDANGVRIVVELVEAAKRGRGEYVDYLWPKPGGDTPVQKIATSRLYPPWGWVLQTGLYVDDVAAEFRRQLAIYGSGIGLAMALILVASLRIARSISKPLQELQATVGRLAGPDPAGSDAAGGVGRQNEIAQLTGAFETMTVRLAAANAELRQQASSDSLTGLPNRRAFLSHLAGAFERAQPAAPPTPPIVLMLLDLDRFKEINDTLGHPVGDEVLKIVARRLAHALRDTDTVARLGGDEFAIALNGVAQAERISGMAQKILDALALPMLIGSHQLNTAASIGIAVAAAERQPIEELLRQADLALYLAKAAGRNTFRYYTAALGGVVARRLLIENHLREAIGRQELSLHYQPRIAAGNGGMAGVEALLRWHNAALGPVPPADFIPIAEDSGLILPIGEWALEEACRQHVAWRAAGLDSGLLAVNVSPRQFRQEGLAKTVEKVLERTGMAAERLELELTEDVLLDPSPETAATLARLNAMRVRLSIDDFGTGYSSLSFLKRFPLARLKIDRSFIGTLESDPGSQAIVGAIIAAARKLGLQVTAEGVENHRQRAILDAMGCDEFQGFYFSEALPPDELQARLGSAFVPAGVDA